MQTLVNFLPPSIPPSSFGGGMAFFGGVEKGKRKMAPPPLFYSTRPDPHPMETRTHAFFGLIGGEEEEERRGGDYEVVISTNEVNPTLCRNLRWNPKNKKKTK